MSIRALEHVVKHVRVGGFAQGVLLYLARCHNDKTGQCNPSRENMREFFSADGAPCTLKRIDRALADLRKAGALESKKVRVASGVLNYYVFPGIDNTHPEKPTGVDPKTGVTPKLGGSPQNGQGVAPKMGSFKQPQNGGGNREIEKGIEKEVIVSRENVDEYVPKTGVPKTVLEPTNNVPTTERLTDTPEICDEIVYEFTIRCPDLPKVTKVTEPRKRLINARLKEVGMEKVLHTFDRVQKSDWLCGRKTDWRANFDWVMKKENFQKITEGNYDNRGVPVDLGKKVNGQTKLLTVQQRKEANDWGMW